MPSSLKIWCQLRCTRVVTHACPKTSIVAAVRKIRTRERHRQACVTAESSAINMGILHADMENILYDQDAIAEAVAKLGK